MPATEIHVTATWDTRAAVWVADCEELPGLLTEADTIEELREKINVRLPDLLAVYEDIGGVSCGEISVVIKRDTPCLPAAVLA